MKSGNSKLREEVTGNDIAEVVSKWTDPAVRSVSEAIQQSRAGLSDPCRPIASFIFMGPTGVGKTELAKALASYLFNTEEALVRIDMMGYDEGQLTETVRRIPYAVILFDEIEKARCDVFNVFLQILDDGRVTDSQGQTVSFTKHGYHYDFNVGSQYILNSDEEKPKDLAYETIKQRVMEAARDVFRPEFMNHVDENIVFQPLDHKEISSISRLKCNLRLFLRNKDSKCVILLVG
ncbi:chaperone protein ClpB3, chloroplastic-like [Hibiscus syriacus]|uniref:chaperone protein ClpB3, chloroplastic-like n=1 Tax=Hibiscus syriacus TaxID=106335 RepID=UPI00192043CD|nr:chaperone protein ClpB3, chloroplastic-like [Hibiscus syriacus]